MQTVKVLIRKQIYEVIDIKKCQNIQLPIDIIWNFEGQREDDENVEIISCDAKEAIQKFKSGDLAAVSELKGEQITEAVEARFYTSHENFFVIWVLTEIFVKNVIRLPEHWWIKWLRRNLLMVLR